MSDQTKFNLWQYKPWWCQPWTILLTGIGMIVGSWLLFKLLWLTLLVSLGISLWWFYFLILLPRLLQASITEKSS
ncbi:MAG: DUF6737 family protein [Snowella sp.]|nr:DUF6737 family protein [Snowella sp.]